VRRATLLETAYSPHNLRNRYRAILRIVKAALCSNPESTRNRVMSARAPSNSLQTTPISAKTWARLCKKRAAPASLKKLLAQPYG